MKENRILKVKLLKDTRWAAGLVRAGTIGIVYHQTEELYYVDWENYPTWATWMEESPQQLSRNSWMFNWSVNKKYVEIIFDSKVEEFKYKVDQLMFEMGYKKLMENGTSESI